MSATRARHVPQRRCAVCRSSRAQAELIRFARDEHGRWRLDPQRKAGGRGMWVCLDARCHERKALGRAFRGQAADVAGQLAEFTRDDQGQPTRSTSQNGGIDV